MKKTLIFSIGLLSLSVAGVVSCGNIHRHFYGSSWDKDETHHWHTCQGSTCSEISDKAEHTGGTATETEKAICEVCGSSYGSVLPHEHVYTIEKVDEKYLVSAADCDSKAIYKKSCSCGEAGTETFESGEVLGHDYADTWTTDSTNHWHVCERQECNSISDKVEHTGGTATETTKAKCSVCNTSYGSLLPHTHVYSQEVVKEDYLVSEADCESKAIYTKSCSCGEAGTETFEYGEVLGHDYDIIEFNTTHHWNECHCGAKTNEETHSYSIANTDSTYHWIECECGATSNVETHAFVVNKDSTYHWNKCECGVEIEKEEHNYTYTYSKDNQTLKYTGSCSCGHTINGDISENTLEVSTESDLKLLLTSNYNVVLANNITLTSPIVLEGSVDVTIDLNGHSLLIHKETPEQNEIVRVFLIKNNAKLTINGEGVVSATTGETASQDSVEVLHATDGAEVTINNGSFYANGCNLIYATRGAKVDINGGTFESSRKWNGYLFTLDIDETISDVGTITVYGGTFIEFDPSKDAVDGDYKNKVPNGYCSVKDGNNYVVAAHIQVTDEAVSADCENDGLTEGSHCSRCNYVFLEQETVDALGHDYPQDWVNSQDGNSHEISCETCGLVYKTELHYGGTPTTTSKAICNVCDLEYNEILPSQEETTITISDYASENGWQNATKYPEITYEDINISIEGGGNSGKYYDSGTNWRLYQTETPEITISINNGTIISVTISYSSSNTGALTYDEAIISTGDTVEVNDSCITFGVGNTGTATNGQVRITRILIIHQEEREISCSHPSFEYVNNDTTSHCKVCLSCEAILSASTCSKLEDADCTTDSRCICGRLLEEKWGHSFSEWEQISPKNCENAEVLGRECSTCSTKETKTGEAAIGHNMVFDFDDEQHWKVCENGCGKETEAEDHFGGLATPTEKAVCSICNTAYGEKSDHIHNFTKQDKSYIYQITAETCTEEGEYYYSCSVDGCNLSSRGTPLEDTFTVEALDHDFSDEWEIDDNNHWHICEREDCEAISDKSTHSGGTPTPTEKAVCNVCKEAYGDTLEAAATFEFGSNKSVAEGTDGHKDGSAVSTEKGYSETNNGYTLELEDFSAVYTKAFDSIGNSCLKFGTKSEAGTCSFTVSEDVNLVIIYIAKYKDAKSIVTINYEKYELESNSLDGEYDIIEIDTSSEKTITITTEKGGYRAMLNTIKFYN